MSRRLNFMPSRYAGSAEFPADVRIPASPSRATVAEWSRAARARRSAEAMQADYRARRLLDGLGRLRIAGRHTAAAVSASVLDSFFKEYGVPAEQGRAAYEAGQRDRQLGVRCMCNQCAGQVNHPAAANESEGTP